MSGDAPRGGKPLTLTVNREDADAARVIGLRREVTLGSGPSLGELIHELSEKVTEALPSIPAAGPGTIVYIPTGDRTLEMLVGCGWELHDDAPYGLEAFDLPAGPVATVHHVGPYERLPFAHAVIHSWLRTRGVKDVGVHWEVYQDPPRQGAPLEADVFYRILGAGEAGRG